MLRKPTSEWARHDLAFASVAALLVCVAGCPGLTSFLDDAPLQFARVGKDGNELLYVAAVDGPSATYRLYSVNVANLEQSVVAEGIAAEPDEIAASADWVAWIDRDAREVVVRNLATGETRSTFAGLDDWSAEFNRFLLREIRGHVLVVQLLEPVGSFSPALDESHYILLDLRTDELTVVRHAWGYEQFALADDFMAVFNDLPSDAEEIALELTTNLDVINLVTGDRETVAPDIRVLGDGGRIFAAGDAVVWSEFRAGGFEERVMIHDTTAGETRVLVSNITRDGRDWCLVDVHGHWLLLQESGDDIQQVLTGIPTTIESFDGEIIASFFVPAFAPEPEFVGNYVVWLDSIAAQLGVFDPAAGVTEYVDLGVE
jgi:hypothetical protein